MNLSYSCALGREEYCETVFKLHWGSSIVQLIYFVLVKQQITKLTIKKGTRLGERKQLQTMLGEILLAHMSQIVIKNCSLKNKNNVAQDNFIF